MKYLPVDVLQSFMQEVFIKLGAKQKNKLKAFQGLNINRFLHLKRLKGILQVKGIE